MLAAGVTYRAVYHRDGFAVPCAPCADPEADDRGGRAGPADRERSGQDVHRRRPLGLIPLEVACSADASLLINESSMPNTLIALFDLVWERAIPIQADGSCPRPPRVPAPTRAPCSGCSRPA